ncbi:MAG: hypothetical protein DRI46_08060 [Chloroflexi bacterium]|nr:MAG: hypothetical protein DRI46_08060 [Chloroflexota bacterium]
MDDKRKIIRNTLSVTGKYNMLFGTNVDGERVSLGSLGYAFSRLYGITSPPELNRIINSDTAYEEELGFTMVDRVKKNILTHIYAGLVNDNTMCITFVRSNGMKMHLVHENSASANRALDTMSRHRGRINRYEFSRIIVNEVINF